MARRDRAVLELLSLEFISDAGCFDVLESRPSLAIFDLEEVQAPVPPSALLKGAT